MFFYHDPYQKEFIECTQSNSKNGQLLHADCENSNLIFRVYQMSSDKSEIAEILPIEEKKEDKKENPKKKEKVKKDPERIIIDMLNKVILWRKLYEGTWLDGEFN